MNLNKHLPDGGVIRAPDFTYRVLHGVPVLFHLAEWLLFIVAFQYVDQRFHSVPARVVWWLLALALSMYMGVLVSNIAWRYIREPFKGRARNIFMSYLLPVATSGLVFLLLHFVVKDMVAAEIG